MYSVIRNAPAACLVAIVGVFPADATVAQKGKIELQWFGQSATKITTVEGKLS